MRIISNQSKNIHCNITLPLSKSIVNRLLVIHHLSGGDELPILLSDSSDTVAMQSLLHLINSGENQQIDQTEINVGNAGTVMRFLTAVLAVTPGKWLITGIDRMLQRPVKPLTDALGSLGAELTFVKNPGYPPIQIKGNAHLKGGKVQLDAGISSQFISALMMIAPVLNEGIEIEMIGNITSGSYIHMTEALMRKTGAKISFVGNVIRVEEVKYNKFDISGLIEPDWSAAAFWFQVAAFADEASILLVGLNSESVQGDSVLPAIYAHLGVKTDFTNQGVVLSKSDRTFDHEFNYDFSECPDLAQAVIVTCAALGIKGSFSGLKTLRVKETDRIEALRNELSRLGYSVEVVGDIINLNVPYSKPSSGSMPVYINCYDDHRMAMAFATLALVRDDICINEPEVVKKSYPGFWKDLETAGFKYSDINID